MDKERWKEERGANMKAKKMFLLPTLVLLCTRATQFVVNAYANDLGYTLAGLDGQLVDGVIAMLS